MKVGLFQSSYRNLLTLIGIGFIVAAVSMVLFFHSPSSAPPDPPQNRVESAEPADSSLGVIHQVFTKNGRVEWILDASQAHQMKEQNLIELENISAVYFFNEGREVRLTANRGYWHTDSNNVEVLGNVVVSTGGYRLISDNMNLRHQKRYMFSNDKVLIFGPDANLVADSMEFFIDTETAKFNGNVEGLFNERINLAPLE